MGFFQNYRYPFGGPYNKDYNNLGSILGCLILGIYLIQGSMMGLQKGGCKELRLQLRVIGQSRGHPCWPFSRRARGGTVHNPKP